MKNKQNNNKLIYILLFFIVLIIILFFVIYFFFLPKLVLKGPNKYVINYNEKYVEPGYKAIDNGKIVNEKVKVSGFVNSKKLGNYKISYSIKKGFFKRKVIRTVKVRDIKKPNINLTSTDDIYVCPGKKYKQEKFNAVDNYDGDITDKVKITKEDDFIRYAVSDSSGNYTVITRKIKYEDIQKPVINLNFGEYVTTFLNEEYEEAGYSAEDNCDGDITNKVKVSGNVDITNSGIYKVKYSVKDSFSNKIEKERLVSVVKRGSPGTIYLTFDDGPKSGTTNIILDILKEEGIKATFFVTNSGPDSLIIREYNEGHTVALHTASHNYSQIYSSIDNYFNDLKLVHNRVLNLTGNDSKLIRFPGGSSNTISRRYKEKIMTDLTNEVLKQGYKYYDWNINSGDAGKTTEPDEVYQNVISKLSHDKVNIVLMHDIKPHTRDALKRIIEYGKNNGYAFDSIKEDTEMYTQKVNN